MSADESSYPIDQKFAIVNFIENRWQEAKQELAKHDSAFSQAIAEYYDNVKGGPNPTVKRPTPSYRLSDRWYRLLETTVDVSQQLERVSLTVRKLGEATVRRDAVYFHYTWVEDIYSLCEKVKLLVVHSCRLHGLKKDIESKYRQEVDAEVQDHLGTVRHAIIHGADNPKEGGRGVNARAVTEESLWEGVVSEGPDLIWVYLVNPGDDKLPQWTALTSSRTKTILVKLGVVLYKLDGVINRKLSQVVP